MEIHWESRLIGSTDIFSQIMLCDLCIPTEQFMRLGAERAIATQKNITRK